MLFVWDSEKAKSNLVKHGVSFELAQTVFDDPLHLSILDQRIDDEERWVTIGRSVQENTLIVIHVYKVAVQGEEMIRIISARKATRKEKNQYEEGI